jgi:hypothetical protein
MEFLQVANQGVRKQACGRSTRCLVKSVLLVALCACAAAESRQPAVITSLKVDVLQEKIEIRIEANRDFSMQTTVLTHPDRIVLDATGAISKVKEPEIPINTGPVKSVRIALLQADPPVTRIVVDSSTPLPYSFRTERNSAFLDIALDTAPPVVTAKSAPELPRVTYDRGLLTVAADNSSLAEILNAIHSRIGGTTEFPAAAASERATVHLGPAPLLSVLSALLLGSPFDYVIVGSGQEPGGIQIVLSEKSAHPENQQRSGETLALASASEAARVNDVAGDSVPVSDDDGGHQPDGTAQFMINLPPVGAMATEEASPPPSDESSPGPQSQADQPTKPRPSRESPRVPPPGKGH